MRLLIEIFLIAGLVWLFRTVRATRIADEITQTAQRRANRKSAREADAWIKSVARDTRPDRGRYIHNAPSYTEHTGKFKIPS